MKSQDDYHSIRFAELTYEEIRERAKSGAMAVVPTGCTEQQGPHLPVGFDSWLAEEVSLAAAEELAKRGGVSVLVLPTLPFGPAPEHRSFGAGFIDLPRGTHEAVVRGVLDSLADQGFERIVVWRGCGGHDLQRAVEEFNTSHSSRSRAYLPALPYHDIWCRIGDASNPGGHADAFATSLALYLRPEMVRRDRIERSPQTAVDWDDPDLDFGRYSKSGVIGDPTAATAELGKRLWLEVVKETVRILEHIAEPDR